MEIQQPPSTPTAEKGSSFLARPSSSLGWWATVLAAICLFALATIAVGAFKNASTHTPMKICGLVMLVSGLAAGVTSLLAMLRHRERSWMVILPLTVGIFFLLVLISELVGLT